MPTPHTLRRFPSAILLVVVAAAAMPALAQTPAAPAPTPASSSDAAPPAAKTPVDTTSLASLAWLAGCWRGAVNQREFVEQWLPLRGGIMLGVSHNVMQDRTLDYEYLRLEPRADGIHYVAWPSGKPPTDFRLATATSDDNGTQFAFANVAEAFPQRLVYRRGAEGWLYASIEGKVSGEVRSVTYPMRRVNCETGELITK